jgi:hypothetical protein
MIATHAFYHFTEATVGLILVALIGAIGVWQGRRGKRVEAKVDTTIANQDTANGKALGETVHDIAQTQEIISAQLHTNTRELLAVRSDLKSHIEETAPLIEQFITMRDEHLEKKGET